MAKHEITYIQMLHSDITGIAVYIGRGPGRVRRYGNVGVHSLIRVNDLVRILVRKHHWQMSPAMVFVGWSANRE